MNEENSTRAENSAEAHPVLKPWKRAQAYEIRQALFGGIPGQTKVADETRREDQGEEA